MICSGSRLSPRQYSLLYLCSAAFSKICASPTIPTSAYRRSPTRSNMQPHSLWSFLERFTPRSPRAPTREARAIPLHGCRCTAARDLLKAAGSMPGFPWHRKDCLTSRFLVMVCAGWMAFRLPWIHPLHVHLGRVHGLASFALAKCRQLQLSRERNAREDNGVQITQGLPRCHSCGCAPPPRPPTYP